MSGKNAYNASRVGKGLVSKQTYMRRANLVRDGKAMWVPIRTYSPEEALRVAGLA